MDRQVYLDHDLVMVCEHCGARQKAESETIQAMAEDLRLWAWKHEGGRCLHCPACGGDGFTAATYREPRVQQCRRCGGTGRIAKEDA